jgi:hypothetical protein
MSEETTTDTTSAVEPEAATEPAAEAKPERTFTQEEVTKLLAKEYSKGKSKGKREAKAELESKPVETKAKETEPKEELVSRAELDAFRAELELERKLSGKELSEEELQTIRENPSAADALIEAYMNKAEKPPAVAETESASPPEPAQDTPGSARGAPAHVREMDALKWTRDDVERMVRDGTFLQRVNEYRDSLPGGANGIFRRRIPTAR